MRRATRLAHAVWRVQDSLVTGRHGNEEAGRRVCEDEGMDSIARWELQERVAARLDEEFSELWGVLQAAAIAASGNARHGQIAKAIAAYLAARGRLAIAALEDLRVGRRPVLFGIRDDGLKAMAPYATLELPLDAVLRWLKAVHERLVERIRASDPSWWDLRFDSQGGRSQLAEALGIDRDGHTPYAAAANELRRYLNS